MSDKEFRSEIIRVVKNTTNKEEFGRLCSSVHYFKSQFPEIAKKFEIEIEKISDHKKWAGFLREIRFSEDLGIPYMYKRTMQLCLRFTNKYDEFFRIDSEAGSFTLPTRLDKFLKIALIASDFTHKIFPSIENNINFKPESVIESTNTVRGTINWNSTILSSLQKGEEHPTQFTCLINQSNFETPENILALLCLLKLQTDLESLIIKTIEIEYARKEARMIIDLKTRIDFLVSHTHMKYLISKYEKFRFLNLGSKIVRNYEDKTKFRIERGIVKQKAYSDLLKWLKKYRGYNIEVIQHDYAEFPIRHERSLDTMYELWIFFEMVNYFREQKNVKVLSILKNSQKGFAGFELEIERKLVKLNFQDERTGWTNELSIPDFTVEIDEEIPIIMDPKNYSSTQTGDAIHKMLGYMLNLGKFNTEIGILFFPYSIDRNKIDDKKYRPAAESTDFVFGKQLSFSTLILNPTKPDELRENLGIVFDHVYDVVLKKINPEN